MCIRDRDIEGLGDALLNKLVEQNMIKTAADIYSLDFGKIAEMEDVYKRQYLLRSSTELTTDISSEVSYITLSVHFTQE